MMNAENQVYQDNRQLNIIKDKKIVLYLTKVVLQLNATCNNLIKEEKFQRAIVMFTNKNEDFDTIKGMIDWHVQNEKRQYYERLEKRRKFHRLRHKKSVQEKRMKKIKAKTLSRKKAA